VGRVAPNFDIGSIRFENTRHRILVFAVTAAMPVIVTVAMTGVTAVTAVIAAAHTFVLTVSHVSPVR
jgi:hypothetical protein